MEPARKNFTIQQGATWRKVLTLHQGDASSAVVDLTNYTAALVAKDKPGDATPLLSLTNGSGITLGGAAGTITILQSATQTAAYGWANADYRLSITAPGGDTTTLLYGTLNVNKF